MSDNVSEAAPLFILSFRQRDELAQHAANAGWQVIAARRAEGAEQRYLSSGAAIAVIDARGALEDGLAASRALGGYVAANGGAMLALVSRGDTGALGDFYDAGATHFLASPAGEAEFVQMLRFAERHAARVGGDWRGAARTDETLGWSIVGGAAVLTPALASALGTSSQLGIGAFRRTIDRGAARAIVAAIRRIAAGGATAVAHELPPHGRVVQHLQRDGADGMIGALVERLGAAPDATERLRGAWSRERDAGDARRWIAQAIADGRPVTAILIALTRFDIVNAAYGRAAGDSLLRAAARRIEDIARELVGRGAIVARLGGSEFLLACEATGERASLVTARLDESLARPFPVADTLAVLGSRTGVAEREAADDAPALLRRASEALARAKASDGATMRMAEPSGVAPIDALAVDLHHAIEGGDIDVLFQPQVAIASGAIVGVEALARWDHATLGSLGADTLFAAADRADLGIALSDHIQELVLRRAAAWPPALGRLRLSLNLTAADIARPRFAELFLARVDASGFPRGRLTLEITESGLIEDLGLAAALLAQLRGAGCRVAIDDFGTGYSSLAYLKALPLDYLKIDKALAQDIAGSPRDRVVVRGVIEMARSLGLAVIAEGVETAEQLDLLARDGCTYYQGFLCAEAIDAPALVALVGG